MIYDIQQDWNVRPENTSADNTAALQHWMNNHDQRSAVVVPPGVYRVDGTISVEKNEDWRALLDIRGYGRRASVFKQEAAGDPPILRFGTSSGNFRDLTISDLSFQGGGLELNKCVYNRFENLQFEHLWDAPCLQLGANTGLCVFSGCWWVHCNQTVEAPNASAEFVGCTLGEQAGHVRIKGSRWTGCYFHGAGHHAANDPPQIEGYPALFETISSGTYRLVNCIVTLPDNQSLAAIQLCRRFSMNGCDVVMSGEQADVPLFVLRNRTEAEQSRGLVQMVGCSARHDYRDPGTGKLYESVLGKSTDHWIIESNQFDGIY